MKIKVNLGFYFTFFSVDFIDSYFPGFLFFNVCVCVYKTLKVRHHISVVPAPAALGGCSRESDPRQAVTLDIKIATLFFLKPGRSHEP